MSRWLADLRYTSSIEGIPQITMEMYASLGQTLREHSLELVEPIEKMRWSVVRGLGNANFFISYRVETKSKHVSINHIN